MSTVIPFFLILSSVPARNIYISSDLDVVEAMNQRRLEATDCMLGKRDRVPSINARGG